MSTECVSAGMRVVTTYGLTSSIFNPSSSSVTLKHVARVLALARELLLTLGLLAYA